MTDLTLVPSQRPASGHSGPESHQPDPDAAVCARGLSREYKNPWTLKVVHGLKKLTLDVHRGEVMGYLGPNGAGKTTTLKLLTGLHKPTAGRAWLFGEPIEHTVARRALGFLPEQPYFYDHLNGIEYLEFVGQLSGLAAHDATRRARHWLGRVGLGERPKLLVRKYSKGMLQRLGMAATLIHEPELLILDEPMSGLDPFGRRDVRDLILEQRERGTTVLFSSHILPDVEMICDRVAIVIHGELARVATVGELMSDGHGRVEIRCAGTSVIEIPARFRDRLHRVERIHETAFVLAGDGILSEVLAWLLQVGVEVRAVTPQRASLEQLFMDAVVRAGPSAAERSA
jgi:ABC-2 type transport system ATP-binding protein